MCWPLQAELSSSTSRSGKPCWGRLGPAAVKLERPVPVLAGASSQAAAAVAAARHMVRHRPGPGSTYVLFSAPLSMRDPGKPPLCLGACSCFVCTFKPRQLFFL